MATWDDPGRGYNRISPTLADLWATQSAYDDIRLVCEFSSARIGEAWTGDASLAWQSSFADVMASLDPIQETLLSARAALGHYQDAVTAIRDSAVHWQDQIVDAQRVLAEPITSILVDPAEHTIDTARHRTAYLRLAEARTQLELLLARRSQADNDAIAALGDATPSAWQEQYAGLAAVGITADTLSSSVESKRAMQDLMERVIAGDVSAETLSALNGLLAVHGDDGYWMSALYTAIGGAGVAELINTLARQLSGPSIAVGEITENDRMLAELAGRIRSSLAAGSENWSATVAEGFIDSMLVGPLDGNPAPPDASTEFTLALSRAEAAAYLFSAPDSVPMPENLAVALANQVDTLERLNPNGHTFETLLAPSNQPMLFNAVDRIDAGEPYLDGQIAAEVGGWGNLPSVAFDSLGNYPDAALEFLSPGDDLGLGAARVVYWFGDREWAEVDGFAGVSSLLFGAMQAEGGPSSLAYDQDVGLRASDLFTLSVTELLGNGGFLGGLSDRAAMDLASGSGVFFDAFADYMAADEDVVAHGDGSAKYTPFDSSETRWGPGLTLEDFRLFIGQVAVNPSGAAVIDRIADSLADGYFDYATATGSPAVLDAAMLRMNSLNGFMDGAGVGASLAAALREDELTEAQFDAALDAAGFVVGFIPMGSSLAEGGVGLLIDALGPDALEFVMGDSYHYDEEVAAAAEGSLASVELARFENGRQVWELMQTETSPFGVTEYEAPREQWMFESLSHYVDYCREWYEGFIAQPEMAGFDTAKWTRAYEMAHQAGK